MKKKKSVSNILYMRRNRRRIKDMEYFSGNKEEVLKRDGYKCTLCGKTTSICIHHIDGIGKGYKKTERNDSPSNLVTLCHSCHRKVHYKPVNRKCGVEGCNKKYLAREYCQFHYNRWWRINGGDLAGEYYSRGIKKNEELP